MDYGRVADDIASEMVAEPWMMTRQEIIDSGRWLVRSRETGAKADAGAVESIDLEVAHRSAVRAAIRAGKPVPAKVLAEYPDLRPSAPIGL